MKKSTNSVNIAISENVTKKSDIGLNIAISENVMKKSANSSHMWMWGVRQARGVHCRGNGRLGVILCRVLIQQS